jgi:hypothetical protein
VYDALVEVGEVPTLEEIVAEAVDSSDEEALRRYAANASLRASGERMAKLEAERREREPALFDGDADADGAEAYTEPAPAVTKPARVDAERYEFVGAEDREEITIWEHKDGNHVRIRVGTVTHDGTVYHVTGESYQFWPQGGGSGPCGIGVSTPSGHVRFGFATRAEALADAKAGLLRAVQSFTDAPGRAGVGARKALPLVEAFDIETEPVPTVNSPADAAPTLQPEPTTPDVSLPVVPKEEPTAEQEALWEDEWDALWDVAFDQLREVREPVRAMIGDFIHFDGKPEHVEVDQWAGMMAGTVMGGAFEAYTTRGAREAAEAWGVEVEWPEPRVPEGLNQRERKLFEAVRNAGPAGHVPRPSDAKAAERLVEVRVLSRAGQALYLGTAAPEVSADTSAETTEPPASRSGGYEAPQAGSPAEALAIGPEPTGVPPVPLVPEDVTPELSADAKVAAVLAGDVAHLASMPDLLLKRARDAAFLQDAPAEIAEAIRFEQARRAQEFDTVLLPVTGEDWAFVVHVRRTRARPVHYHPDIERTTYTVQNAVERERADRLVKSGWLELVRTGLYDLTPAADIMMDAEGYEPTAAGDGAATPSPEVATS